MIDLFIHWNPNPELFEIFGLSIRWYGMLFASGFFFGYFIVRGMLRREGISEKLLDRLTIYMVIGTVVGARLGHCLFYDPAYYLSKPWEILYLRQGGLASHGAAIGIILSLFFFSRKEKRPLSWVLDRIVVVVALAGGLIRLGNLMNSEIIGSQTDQTWGFVFKTVDNVPRHPSQLYEAIVCFIVFGVLYRMYYKKTAETKPYQMFGFFLASIFLFRFFVEFIKENQVDFEKGMTLDMGQWLSIPFALLGLWLFFRPAKKI